MKRVAINFIYQHMATYHVLMSDGDALDLRVNFMNGVTAINRVESTDGSVHCLRSDSILSISFENVEEVEK